MPEWPTLVSVVGSSFLASIVEVVEAFTIVLAVSIVRGWRPAIAGTLGALAVLAAAVLIFGPLLDQIPITVLQLTIGILTLLFGLRWLRKATLRSIGVIALHDEEKTFNEETATLIDMERQREQRQDWIAGVTAFKAVLLEGLEVVFIVIAVGSTRVGISSNEPGQSLIWLASLGALGACVLVLGIGAVVHRPLSQVPENTLKFTVGIMLSAFGIFWTGEGFWVEWPGADLSIIAFAAVFFITAQVLISMYKPQFGAFLKSVEVQS